MKLFSTVRYALAGCVGIAIGSAACLIPVKKDYSARICWEPSIEKNIALTRIYQTTRIKSRYFVATVDLPAQQTNYRFQHLPAGENIFQVSFINTYGLEGPSTPPLCVSIPKKLTLTDILYNR